MVTEFAPKAFAAFNAYSTSPSVLFEPKALGLKAYIEIPALLNIFLTSTNLSIETLARQSATSLFNFAIVALCSSVICGRG